MSSALRRSDFSFASSHALSFPISDRECAFTFPSIITGLTWISLQAKEASISSRLSANMESYNQALATLTEKLDALK